MDRKNDNSAKEHADYLLKLRTEFGQIDQSLTITNRLLQTEIDRVIKGGEGSKPIEIHRDNPMKLSTKLLIPNKEFPKVNFVGKLIGPGGSNMKRLQHELGIRMAVYGRGSMRDKAKEEELRKEGGKKYGHLNDDLHVYLEVQAPAEQAYEMIGRAIATIKPYFDPSFEDGNMPPPEADPYSNGAGRGRGRGRGGAPLLAPRGGGMGGPPAPLAPRGGRGAPRGGRGAPARPAAPPLERAFAEDDYYGAPAAPPAAPAAHNAYAGYEADTSYEQQDAYRSPPARDPYAASSRVQSSEVQSFDYGHGSSGDAYEAPAQDWDRRDPYQQRAPASRGAGRAAAAAPVDHRAHPYERPAPRHAAPRY